MDRTSDVTKNRGRYRLQAFQGPRNISHLFGPTNGDVHCQVASLLPENGKSGTDSALPPTYGSAHGPRPCKKRRICESCPAPQPIPQHRTYFFDCHEGDLQEPQQKLMQEISELLSSSSLTRLVQYLRRPFTGTSSRSPTAQAGGPISNNMAGITPGKQALPDVDSIEMLLKTMIRHCLCFD